MELSNDKTIALISILVLAEKTGEEFHKQLKDYIEHTDPALGLRLFQSYLGIVAAAMEDDSVGTPDILLKAFKNILENENV